ncbi:MAG: peptidoglycan-binding protein, partial [Proteobacteria bacterium]|nr:peptidoglycan-binding protein [Pseudomonadota bacterium]
MLTSYAPEIDAVTMPAKGWFDLEDWVGPQHPSKRGDVAKLEGILANAGDYSLERTQGPTGYWGLALDDGIRKYQKRNGLKTDGILRPGGPTIEHMRENFGALLDGHEPPTPDDIDAHHEV